MNSFQRVTRGIFLLLWTLAWSFLLLELGIRAYFSIRVDPDVLLWGTQWHREQMQQQFMRGQNVFEHENAQTGYAKYFPGQKRSDVDGSGMPFSVTINRRGFRGANYQNIKPAGTLRVLALGASSTFGFGNRDNETYPFLLEELLNEQFEGAACGRYSQAEVINLGIPHLDSSQLAELFIAEGLAYQPDAVTIYSGYNNTRGLGQKALLKKWSRHWLLINFVRVALQQNLRSSESLLRSETEVRTLAFIAGLERILDAARPQGIAVLPITQQVRALPVEKINEEHISYATEMSLLEQKLKTDGELSLLEGKVLMHQSLTRALRRWAQDNGLELVDAIELLDEHRYLLTSYVHLAPLANHLLALALVDGLAQAFECPQLLISDG